MRKGLSTVLLMLLTATLFVACSSTPKESGYVAEIKITATGNYADYTGTYYLKNSDDYCDDCELYSYYKLYKNKECTEVLLGYLEPEGPEPIVMEYTFNMEIHENGILELVAFVDKTLTDINNGEKVAVEKKPELGKGCLCAHFSADDEFTFGKSDNIEIVVKFVQNTSLICKIYVNQGQ